MENPIKMGWFGGTTIFGNIHMSSHMLNSLLDPDTPLILHVTSMIYRHT